MGTRSRIGIQLENGVIESIYCNFDGYPSYNGNILLTYYKDRNKVQQLIDLGDISSLGPEIGEKQDFNNPSDDWTLVYGRDRGERGTQKTINTDGVVGFFGNDCGEEYFYLFTKDNKWLVSNSSEELVPLEGHEELK